MGEKQGLEKAGPEINVRKGLPMIKYIQLIEDGIFIDLESKWKFSPLKYQLENAVLYQYEGILYFFLSGN